MKKLIAALCLLVAGCGSGSDSPAGVEFVEVSPVDLIGLTSAPALGAARQSTPGSGVVYMLPFELYGNQECYDFILAHEMRHIDEGDFHPRKVVAATPLSCAAVGGMMWKVYIDTTGKTTWE